MEGVASSSLAESTIAPPKRGFFVSNIVGRGRKDPFVSWLGFLPQRQGIG